jgi:hypothetical protein
MNAGVLGEERTWMRLAPLYLGLAILLLVGCARSTFDCAIGEPRSDCAPGTAGAEKRMQQQQDAKTFNTIDDARCRSFAKDSQSYLDCRRKAAETRKTF